MRVRVGVAVAVILLAAMPLAAHHSFNAVYFEDEQIQFEGLIVEFQYKNPHAWVFVEGMNDLRQMQIWAAEWAGTNRLERDGIKANTLRVGDRVRVWASPNRNPTDNRVHLKRIERSDGWKWAGRQQAR